MNSRFLLITVLILFIALCAAAQEDDGSYEAFAEELSLLEESLSTGSVTRESTAALSGIIGRLEETSYRDLLNKARLLFFLTEQQVSRAEREAGLEALEAELAEKTEAVRRAEQSVRRKEAFLVPAVITGGLSFLISDLSFIFSGAAYRRYITADSAAVGGYYQQMWQALDLTGLISATVGVMSVLCASSCLAASEVPYASGIPGPLYTPPENLKLMDSEERIAAIEADLQTAAERLRKAEVRLTYNSAARTALLTTGILSFITSGVTSYLGRETRRVIDSDPEGSGLAGYPELYFDISHWASLGGVSCFSGALLLRIFRPEPVQIERELAEIRAYRQSLE